MVNPSHTANLHLLCWLLLVAPHKTSHQAWQRPPVGAGELQTGCVSQHSCNVPVQAGGLVCCSDTTPDHQCVGAVTHYYWDNKAPFWLGEDLQIPLSSGWSAFIHSCQRNLQEYLEAPGGCFHWSANVSWYDLSRVGSPESLTFIHFRAFGTVLFPVALIKSGIQQAKAAPSLCGSSIVAGSFPST